MPPAMSNDELATLCKGYINRSENNEGSTLSQNRDQATDYYLSRLTNRGSLDGLSDTITGDVADMVDAISAEVAVNLLCGDQLAELEPEGDEDTAPARIESAVVNKVIMEQNSGYELIQSAVQSACLYKNGIVAVEAVEVERPRSRFVGAVDGEMRRVIEGETDGTIDDDGILSWTETRKRVVLRNVAPENWFVDGEYPGWGLDNSAFVAERIYYTRGDLVDLGYTWAQVSALTRAAGVARDDTTRRYTTENEHIRKAGIDEQELIETYWCYVRLAESDHTLRLYKVHMAGNTILDKKPADFIGYATGKIIPVIGRWHGVSIHDRVKPIEDSRSFGMRQWEDNLAYGNNNELILGPGAEEKDAQQRVPGGYLRSSMPGDIAPLAVQDLGSNSKLFQDEMRSQRSERGGSALDMQRADSQILKGQNQVGSMGVGMILGAAELRTAWYARNIAETLFRQVFLLTHETLRRYEVDPVGVWVMGQFAQIDPRNFREREAVNIIGGMSSSERVRRLQALDHSIRTQVEIAQIAGPGVLSDMNSLYQAAIDRDAAAGIDNPNRYWLDPQSPKSLQAQQANAQGAEQQQQLQMQMLAAEKQQEQEKLALDKYKHDTSLKFDYDELAVQSDLKEADILATNITKISTGSGNGNAEAANTG